MAGMITINAAMGRANAAAVKVACMTFVAFCILISFDIIRYCSILSLLYTVFVNMSLFGSICHLGC